MSNEYNVNLLIKQTKLIAKDINKHNKKYSGFKDLLKDNIPESLVDYNGNTYDISSVFHDTNWSNNDKTESEKSSQKFSQHEPNANLELYKNAKLVPHEDASGTTHKLWTVYDDASNNLLEHMVDFSFDISGSYLPILTYYNGSAYVESTMFSDPLWWLIDYENHAISFFNTDSVLNGGTVNISASSAYPPKLTFYRYIGKTKVNNKLSVEGDISCNEVIVSGTTLTSKLDVIDLSYSDLSGVVTSNIASISSNTNNKAPKASPTFTGNVTCNNGLYVSQGSSTHLPIVFSDTFPKPAIQKVSGGLNFFHYLSGSPSYRDYDLFIKSDTGNVGIGTSSPYSDAKLDVSGSIYLAGGAGTNYTGNEKRGIFWAANLDDVNYGIYKTQGSWSGSNYQQLKLSWKTGIIIDPGSGYGKSYLEVVGDISSNSLSMRENGLTMNYNDGVLNIKLAENTSSKRAIMIEGGDDDKASVWIRKSKTPMLLHSNSNGSTNAGDYCFRCSSTGNSNILSVQNNGKVGIGTDEPYSDAKLDVNGSIYLAGGAGTNYTGNEKRGIFWSANSNDVHYGLYKTQGSWSSNDYQQLKLSWSTGIIINPGSAYGKSNLYIESRQEQPTPFSPGDVSVDLIFTINPTQSAGTSVYDAAGISAVSEMDSSTYKAGLAFKTSYHTQSEKMKEHMRITNKGNVGIGTSSPVYPLHVTSFITRNPTVESDFGASNSNYYQFYQNTNVGQIGSTTTVACSVFAHGYYIGEGLLNNSDIRIKENIRDVSDNDALQKLRDISCCFYEYKDKINRGTDTTIGFIAQQVKEHMPIAVSLRKEIIPNEMRLLTDYSWNQLSDSSGNYDLSNNQYKLTIHDISDNSGNTLYRFYVSNDPSGNDEIKKEIKSLENDPKSFVFDQSWNNVLLYGKEVDDFHTLDKNKLFALNFSATQEIDRIQQAEKTKLSAAEAKITALETENAALKARIEAIEAHLGLNQ